MATPLSGRALAVTTTLGVNNMTEGVAAAVTSDVDPTLARLNGATSLEDSNSSSVSDDEVLLYRYFHFISFIGKQRRAMRLLTGCMQ